jgi:signal transduction histidine kinase
MSAEDKLIIRYSEFKLALLTVVLLFLIVFPFFLPSRITINENIYFVVAVLIAWLASGIIYLIAHLLKKNANFRILCFATVITDILFLSALLYILGGNFNYFFLFAFFILGAAFYLDSTLVIISGILSTAIVLIAFLTESVFPLSVSSYLIFIIKVAFLSVVTYFVYLLVLSYIEIQRQKKKVKKYSSLNQEMLIRFSNELRVPLPVIRDFIELLYLEKAGQLNRKQKKILNLLHKNTEKLIEESSSVVFYNQIKTGKLFINKKEINLVDLIKEVIQRNKDEQLTGKSEILYQPRQKKIQINTDKNKLQSALNVFIKNIISHVGDSKKVKIFAKQSKYSPFVKIIITYQGEKLCLSETGTTQNLEMFVTNKIISLLGGNLNYHEKEDGNKKIIIILPSK